MIDVLWQESRGALVVTPLARRLDAEAAVALRERVAPRAAGRALVVVSLARVEAVDCSGLAGLVSVFKRLAPGGELRLASAPAGVRALLAATGLDALFPVHEDLAAALPPAASGAPEERAVAGLPSP